MTGGLELPTNESRRDERGSTRNRSPTQSFMVIKFAANGKVNAVTYRSESNSTLHS